MDVVNAPRRRRSPEEARALALEAAQVILARDGPQGLTLQAVAAAIGMTHGNLTHHFGTSAALQSALITKMGERLAADVQAATLRLRLGEATAREIVDLVFDALERDGHGRLVAWLSSSGQLDRLRPVLDVISTSVVQLRAGEPAEADPGANGAGAITAALLSSALSASLVGPALQAATDLPPDGLRELAARQLESLRVK